MNELLTNFFVAVIIAIIIVTVRYGIPIFKQAVENSQFKNVLMYTAELVRAVEESMQYLSGQTKKEWVTKILKEFLIAKDINLTDEQLDKIIEMTVLDMNNEKKKAEK